MKILLIIALFIGVSLSQSSRSEMTPAELLIGHWFRSSDGGTGGTDYYYNNNNEYSAKVILKDGRGLTRIDKYDILKTEDNSLYLQLHTDMTAMGIGDEFMTVHFAKDGMSANSSWQMKTTYGGETEIITSEWTYIDEKTLPGKEEDGNVLKRKDITGFQEYQWGMTVSQVKDILGPQTSKVDNSTSNTTIIDVSNFVFQGNKSTLQLEFYNNKLYKASVHFVTDNNQASLNAYFSRAELIMDVYGKTIKTAIGRESDNVSSRITSMSINELSYQHSWDAFSGKLTYQIGAGSYGHFIHSFFYSSKEAYNIDNQKLKSEF
ncbi:MAG: hypothetical protein ISS11_05850 [Candidatus Marinimicrobia bacterium]|nr:hypothetical protein [Candidatus Neomarinimicrobiota bacterium]